jgi:tetratricopeptide (TPR) repeat protein
METRDPHQPELADQGEFSNFFNDVRTAWDKFGTPVVGTLAVAAIVYAGYNIFTQRAREAEQNAWIDLYTATSPESLEVLTETINRPSVRAVANLRAGDLLLGEAKTAEPEDAAAILESAKGHYRAALEESEHVVYRLNALDGLGVAAESRGDFDAARGHYQQMQDLAGEDFPYWASIAETRLNLLPRLSEPVEFAPDLVDAEETEVSGAASDEAVEMDTDAAENTAVDESATDAEVTDAPTPAAGE